MNKIIKNKKTLILIISFFLISGIFYYLGTQNAFQKKENYIKMEHNNRLGPIPEAPKTEEKKLSWQKLTKEELNIEIINTCEAEDYINKKVIVEGRVAGILRDLKKNILSLNLGHPYPKTCLNLIITNDYIDNFKNNPENYYINNIVRVQGTIEKGERIPQIILKSPQQIEIGRLE